MRPPGIRRRAVTLAVLVAASVILGVPPEMAGPPQDVSVAGQVLSPSPAVLDGVVVATRLERSVDRAAAKRPGAGALGVVSPAGHGSGWWRSGVLLAESGRFVPGRSPLAVAARAPPPAGPATA